jgi:Raf kinase inhibitor-like YbhB/YbcL family protein
MHTLLQTIILYVMTTTAATLNISSPAFQYNGMIPSIYSCEGKNINPSLVIRNVPEEARSLALIMDDPDAPTGTFVHWVSWNMDPSMNIGENREPGVAGKNGKSMNGYTGPCPPNGTHHYHFKIYALNTMLNISINSGKAELERAMEGHVLAQGELVGLYKKQMQ